MNTLELHKARILMVDDQEGNLLPLEDILRGSGYENLRSLTDARQAVAVFQEFRPDLILLDLMMPYLDGVAVMEQLRPLIPESSYLPVLMLTADVTREAKQLALSTGVKDFLTKPFDEGEVLLRIKNLLETRFLYLSQQQRADERIREQAAFLDNANDAILVRDLEDRVTYWNAGAGHLYGWTAAEAVGRHVDKLFASGQASKALEATREVIATGNWSGELKHQTKDGKEVTVASRWTLVRDSE